MLDYKLATQLTSHGNYSSHSIQPLVSHSQVELHVLVCTTIDNHHVITQFTYKFSLLNLVSNNWLIIVTILFTSTQLTPSQLFSFIPPRHHPIHTQANQFKLNLVTENCARILEDERRMRDGSCMMAIWRLWSYGMALCEFLSFHCKRGNEKLCSCLDFAKL